MRVRFALGAGRCFAAPGPQRNARAEVATPVQLATHSCPCDFPFSSVVVAFLFLFALFFSFVPVPPKYFVKFFHPSRSSAFVYYIYNEIRVCPRLGAARADPPLSRIYPQGQCCLGATLAGTTPSPKTSPTWHCPLQRLPTSGEPKETGRA